MFLAVRDTDWTVPTRTALCFFSASQSEEGVGRLGGCDTPASQVLIAVLVMALADQWRLQERQLLP
jgi:hypothetical protein